MLSRKEGRVGYVIFNNPERHNAVSLDMWEKAVGILDDFRNDKDISVVVVTGAGGKAFVSGADISRFEKERSDEGCGGALRRCGRQELRRVPRIPEADHRHDPCYCIGGGMGLATCCDLRIATEGSSSRCRPPSSGSATATPG